jgi:DNA-binding transcriptional MerR regulator
VDEFGLRFGRSERLVFSIGDFSKITGLTVKTIRFYHEQGLLKPTCVDDETGYRYYDRAKIETARIISRLRSLDFSLEEIAGILASAEDDADLRAVMERQKNELERRIKRYRGMIRSLQEFLNQDEETRQIMAQATFQIEEKTLAALLVAGIRMKGRYADCGAGFARISRQFGRYIRGKPLLLHYDAEYREDDADFEACIPIGNGQPAAGISVHELPGGRCVSLLHKGPYDQLGGSYAKILGYIREKKLHVLMPTREVYLKGPGMILRGNPKNYLTEIQMLIG